MDARMRDHEGKTICPMCNKHYHPVLGDERDTTISIQVQFPNAKSWEREQLISGICSDKCWNKLWGKV